MGYQLLDCYLYLWHTIPALSVLEAGQVFLFEPLLYKDRPKVLSRIRFSEFLSWLAWWHCAYSIGASQQEGLGFKYTIWVRLLSVWILSEYSGFFPQSKYMQFHWLS